jgi:hypothetical protein
MRDLIGLITVLLAGLFVISQLNGCAPYTEVEYIKGPQGERGATGARGTDGKGCKLTSIEPGTLLPFGGAMVECASSSVLISNGRPGFNGADGRDGVDGQDGAPGAPGTLSTIVNLCDGETTYPSKFVEVAVCFNNELYAVYSTNGGFFTKIPPGAYSSNAVGSKCDFTVLPGCEVVR